MEDKSKYPSRKDQEVPLAERLEGNPLNKDTGEHIGLLSRREPLVACYKAPSDEMERWAVLAGVAVVGTVFVSLGFRAYKSAKKLSSL